MDIKQNISGFDHVGLPTNDMGSTVAFYEKLGFSVLYETDNAGERVVFLGRDGFVIEAYQNGQAALKAGAVDHIALCVKDIDAAHAACRAMSLPMAQEEIRFLPFWEKGVRFFILEGPNREKVELIQKL